VVRRCGDGVRARPRIEAIYMRNFLTKLFGDPNEAPLKPYQKIVPLVNALESRMEALSDLELRELANGFRDRLEDGASLDDLLPESFAATR
jgi:preprotein translocase subunit SecA